MRKQLLLFAILAVLLLPGCQKKTFREEEPTLAVDKEEIILPSNYGGGAVKGTIQVTSNRSWTASVTGGAGWVSLAGDGFENPSEVSKTEPLEIICEENSGEEERSAGILIVCAGLQKTVTVRQKGIDKMGGVNVNGIENYLFELYESK